MSETTDPTAGERGHMPGCDTRGCATSCQCEACQRTYGRADGQPVGQTRHADVERVERPLNAEALREVVAALMARNVELSTERDEYQWNALEMARKADLATARAESAEAEVERLRDREEWKP